MTFLIDATFALLSLLQTLLGGQSLILFLFGGLVSAFPLAVAPADLVPLIFGCLVFVFPIAGYCMFLAMINGRPHPTLISGPWDFVGVLLALSGILLLGGPIILAALQPRLQAQLVLGRLPSLHDLGAGSWSFWLILSSVYFLAVFGGAAWVLRRRRAVTLIYNIDPGLLDELLPLVFDRLKLESSRTGNRIFIRRLAGEMAAEPSQAIQAEHGFSARSDRTGPAFAVADVDDAPVGQATLELEPFAAMHHVTLRWRGDDSVRRDVEAELGRQLAEVITPDNPAAGWLLTAATCLFGALLLGLVWFVLFLMRR